MEDLCFGRCNAPNAPLPPSHIVGLFLVRNDGFLVAVRSFGYRGTRIEISTAEDFTTKKVTHIIRDLRECTVAVYAAKAKTERIWLMCEDDGVYTLDLGPLLEAFKDKDSTQLEMEWKQVIPFTGLWRSSMRPSIWSGTDRYMCMAISEDGRQLALVMDVSYTLRLVFVNLDHNTLKEEKPLDMMDSTCAHMQFSPDGCTLILNIPGTILQILKKYKDNQWHLHLQFHEHTCFALSHFNNIYACGVENTVEWGVCYPIERVPMCGPAPTQDNVMHELVFTHDDRYIVAFFANMQTGQRFQNVVELASGRVLRRLNLMENMALGSHVHKRQRNGNLLVYLREVPSNPVFDSKGRTLFVGLPDDRTFAKEDIYENRAIVWFMLLRRAFPCAGRMEIKHIFSFLRCWSIIQDNA